MHNPYLYQTQCLSELETILAQTFLSEQALIQFQRGAIARKELDPICKELMKLSQSYVTGRPEGVDTRAARAYALYYAPINFYKMLHLLPHTAIEPQGQGLKILDFGCGPATASLAALFCFVFVDYPASAITKTVHDEKAGLFFRCFCLPA